MKQSRTAVLAALLGNAALGVLQAFATAVSGGVQDLAHRPRGGQRHGPGRAARGTGPWLPTLVVTALAALTLHGCAALPVAALGGVMLQSGAGAVVKTGTEYTITGTARRTLMIPANAVRAAVLEAFDRAGVDVEENTQQDDRTTIDGKLRHRRVRVELTAFSPTLTGMTLNVKRGLILKDRATSSELLAQVEMILAENPSFARRLDRAPGPGVSASPR